ncbi:efflux RND transporter permease subunit [Pseudomaricurvus sp. HS19]|uniref:efflux RND transporter permease subunit n=1 Tax=Pseudomaricurvus sp. HS19 TaxID=2692626 RepID=UPI00136FD113|nr:multidrug efflux RND transporter permease subunit [Pseudomaricurvus sp. HS19]MYM63355.1 multidrug efflux RND transporter permease subunit [Pseudomaricurvus sp. HS19]
MNFAKFFIDRPIFATVIAIIIMLVGGLAYTTLPVEQYPRLAPPTIQVTANFPGASAETVADTVATPIEQELNGVEGMIYMFSQSTADGSMRLTVTFETGTDLDAAQVLVQNRVAIAEAKLPEAVRRLGITTAKSMPDLMLVINLYSPDGRYDQTYIGNYAVLKLRDRIRRINGIGDTRMFGASEYAMRVWLDPDLIQSYGMTAGDVVRALQAQNVQVAGGTLNRSPQPQQNYFEYSVQTQGRLRAPEEFGNVVVKAGDDGRIVRLRDVARIELGAQDYITRGYLGKYPAVALPVYQQPGANALETSRAVLAEMERAAADFPPGLEYKIGYNPTEFIQQSVDAVEATVYEAIILVVLVIVVFLQTWRAAIIPIVAIPISLIGTFAVMAALGYSLNNLTLFGLVLAIGIVVDDAIVVVENMERNLRNGLSPREAARKTMDEVGAALIAMGLVLVAVFLPTTFLGGIAGKFYQAFGITIAVATVISVAVSLILSPALARILMKPHVEDKGHGLMAKLHHAFDRFNNGMDKLSNGYGRFTGWLIRASGLAVLIYACLMLLTAWQFNRVPGGFIPAQDQGYFVVAIQMAPGTALSETDQVVQQVTEKLLSVDGVANTVAFSGFHGGTFSIASNAAAIFVTLEDFEERKAKGITFDGLKGQLWQQAGQVKEAFVVVLTPPPVRGIGSAGGFKMMLEDRGGRGLEVLNEALHTMVNAANSPDAPAVTFARSFFEIGTPQIYLDIDREKAERLNVPVSRVFEALEVYIGSAFVNDFNYLGRTFRVTAQADAPYRLSTEDVMRIRVRSDSGAMVPLGSIATVEDKAGPSRVPRYNLYPSADMLGDYSPGYSSGDALDTMERLAAELLPDGISYEWTDLAYQERSSSDTAAIAFVLAVIFVFLLLAAQYESWTLPLSVILIVPMCLLSAITGVWLAGMDNNILTQIGFVVLVGLASKNAILIVEFARELEQQGKELWEAAVQAARLRLRPILMTSFAFILGVLPLVLAEGAGAEMRRALGVAVFSGMLGVTFFGLIFTPVFYVLCRKLSLIRLRR